MGKKHFTEEVKAETARALPWFRPPGILAPEVASFKGGRSQSSVFQASPDELPVIDIRSL